MADASVLVTALTEGHANGALARQVVRRGEEVHVPYLADAKVMTAIRGLTRGGVLPEEDAVGGLQDYASLPIVRHANVPLLGRMWQLRGNVSSYDAAYVALAERLRCRLVTGNTRLSRVAGLRCEVEVLQT